ncbi:hypothetical protein [Deinococcus yunweiensis]|uniref:hypothetical protein n=1 Tax=Deinococcus yunweiensis TaxID=367282 RepID=UPI00398F05FA
MSTSEKAQRLCEELKSQSHSKEAMDVLKKFAQTEGKSDKISKVIGDFFNMLQEPVEYEEVLAAGVCTTEDEFKFLQGDIVRTDSAYYLRKRVKDTPAYVVASSTCDLTEGRRECATLYPIIPIRVDAQGLLDNDTMAFVSTTLKFKSTTAMILPRFPHQDPEVRFNYIDFRRPHQIHPNKLKLAHRLYSMTTLGWRIFGTVLRFITSREADNEELIRTSASTRTTIKESA